jgi:hypothetical protein
METVALLLVMLVIGLVHLVPTLLLGFGIWCASVAFLSWIDP